MNVIIFGRRHGRVHRWELHDRELQHGLPRVRWIVREQHQPGVVRRFLHAVSGSGERDGHV